MQDEYTADTIEVMTLREAVRRRPGMWVGGTNDGGGPLHLLLEVAANAIDQVLLGRGTRVDIRIDEDDSVTITDDGPGIPAHALVDLLDRPSNRPTVDGHRPHVHLGPGGIGLPICNAVSDPFEVDTVRAGEKATVHYVGGLQSGPLQVSPTSRPSGTRIRFRPDPRIFQCTRVPRVELTRRLEDLAFLLPSLALTWAFAGAGAAGLVGRVRMEVGDPLGGIAHHRGVYSTADGPITVEVALAWHTHSNRRPQIHSFANLQRTEDGQHVSGMLDGIRAFLPRPSRARHLDGLVAMVAVLLSDVHYGSPTRSSLTNPTVRPAVKQATRTALQAWAEIHPEAAITIRTRNKVG